MDELHFTYYESPIGLLKIGGTENYIGELSFVDESTQMEHGEPGITEVMHQCTEELIEYFHGKRKNFTIPVHQEGTDFQKRVWNELLGIAYGKPSVTWIWLKKWGIQKSSELLQAQMEKIKLQSSFLVTG